APDVLERTLEEMSPREKEVLARLREGLTNRDIAERLGLSERTVQGHRNNLYRKLRVHNLSQLRSRLADAGTP
ncbi:MAG: helix-turn-helix transcriptional regulator, partial [Sutterella sp.]|nr:helix-turn-helix transcriptional regulator [Sutterella sp.]